MDNSSRVNIGVVAKAHGIRGEVSVRLWGENPHSLKAVSKVWLDQDGTLTEKKVVSLRPDKERLLLMLEGTPDRNAAELLRGQEVYVLRGQLAEPEEGEYYIIDLIGCTVSTSSGQTVGTVTDVLQPGGNDVYVLSAPGGGSVMLPAVPVLITDIDLESKTILVDEQHLEEMAVYD